MERKMAARYHPDFVNELFQKKDVFGLSRLFHALATKGEIPHSCTLFNAVLHWVSNTRSGTWTYYESTSLHLQQAVYESLVLSQELNFLADRYRFGMENWQTKHCLNDLDSWLESNEKTIHQCLLDLVSLDKAIVVRLAVE